MTRRPANTNPAPEAKASGPSAAMTAAEAKQATAWMQLPPCETVDFTEIEAVIGYARQLADYLNEIGGYTPGDIPSPAMRRFRHEATTWLRNVETTTFPLSVSDLKSPDSIRKGNTGSIGTEARAIPPELLDAYDILHRILRGKAPKLNPQF